MTKTNQNEVLRLCKRIVTLSHSDSSVTVLKRGIDKMAVHLLYSFKKFQYNNRTFKLFGDELDYFIHPYNATWRNERCIEIAAALHYLNKWGDCNILELGNVMSYYKNHSHYVVDKYEQSPGVHNIDFVDFVPDRLFDGFISISTIEHIGWDEEPRNPKKARVAVERIAGCLRTSEKVLVSMPLGYNDYLDETVRNRELPFQEYSALVRTSENQDWEEVGIEVALEPQYRYGQRFMAANALFFGLKTRT